MGREMVIDKPDPNDPHECVTCGKAAVVPIYGYFAWLCIEHAEAVRRALTILEEMCSASEWVAMHHEYDVWGRCYDYCKACETLGKAR